MPRFMITRPATVIRSAGRTDEPRRARRARRAGQRKIAAAGALLAAWILLHATHIPGLLQVLAYMTSFYLLTAGAQQVGWARGFTARHNTTSTVTVDLDRIERTDDTGGDPR